MTPDMATLHDVRMAAQLLRIPAPILVGALLGFGYDFGEAQVKLATECEQLPHPRTALPAQELVELGA